MSVWIDPRSLDPIRALSDDILLVFVVGMYAGRRRLLQYGRVNRRGVAAVAALGALTAIGGNILMKMYPDPRPEVAFGSWMAANYGVTALCIAGIILLAAKGGRPARSLSIVMTFLFFPYGLGLPDPGATVRLLLHGILFLLQVPLSHWWLARYQYGPAEWVWRSLTYGGAQPMRGPKIILEPRILGA